MQMLPSNDYGGGGPLLPSGVGVLGAAGGLIGRLQQQPGHNRNYSYGQAQSHQPSPRGLPGNDVFGYNKPPQIHTRIDNSMLGNYLGRVE